MSQGFITLAAISFRKGVLLADTSKYAPLEQHASGKGVVLMSTR